MKEEELSYEDGRFQYELRSTNQFYQFFDWINETYILSEQIRGNDQINFVYHKLYVIKLYELLVEGKNYSFKMANKSTEYQDKKAFELIYNSLNQIKKTITDPEFEYLRYYRNNICHIFQEGYELIKEDLTINKRKGKPLPDILLSINSNLKTFNYNDAVAIKHICFSTIPLIQEMVKKYQNIRNAINS